MARQIAGIFGGNGPTSPPLTTLRINTSLQGIPIPWLLGGQQRLAVSLIDYYGLLAVGAVAPGGKGGVGAGGGKGQGGQYFYQATIVLALCEGPGFSHIGENATSAYIYVNGATIAATAATGAGTAYIPGAGNGNTTAVTGYNIFPGDYLQNPWGYTEAYGPAFGNLTRALNYRGITYIAFENFPLGASPQVPSIQVAITSDNTGFIPGQADGDPTICATRFLTDAHRGVGFPAARLGDLTQWQNYTAALGLAVSPVLVGQVQASAFLLELCKATNVAPCWQDGFLTFVPYGDTAVTAGQIQTIAENHQVTNFYPGQPYPQAQPQTRVTFWQTFVADLGVTYQNSVPLTRVAALAYPSSPSGGEYFENGGTYYFNETDGAQAIIINYQYAATASFVPNDASLYDFTIDDYLPNKSSIGSGLAKPNDMLVVVRKPRDQMLNNLRLEYLDSTNNWNPVDIEYKNEASIIRYGRERPSDVKQHHFFTLGAAAQQSAMLQLIREQIPRSYQWTCGRQFLLILELMAIVTHTDPGQGMLRQPVRITEMRENDDGSLTCVGEDSPGTVSAPQYGAQASGGTPINYNEAPGPVNAPIIFEPTDELGGGLQIWAGISGKNTATWGGCFVYASYDGQNYQSVGTVRGASRMGALIADLPPVTINATGQTIDQTNIAYVDLTESAGALGSGTVLDATSLNNRCLVGGEVVSYEQATLTAQYKYALYYMVRGAYGTESDIVDHPAGTPFLRLDANLFEFPYEQNRVGSTIYLKFASFNIFQGGLEDLATVAVYPYVIAGTALASPLPNVANVRTVFDNGFTEVDWDEVADFRTPRYEVRLGSSFSSAVTLGQVAHPPFRVPGDGTYWIAAVAEPTQNLIVYSEAWQSATISGAVITSNTVLTYDLKANNWPGIFTGGAGVDSGLNAIRTGGGNILTDGNVLTTPDMLNFGGIASGTYYPTGVYLDIGYVAQASVNIIYVPTGIPVGQNILTTGNILADPDVLGSAAAQFVSVYPLINTATLGSTDLYLMGDLYERPDLYASSAEWGGLQKYSPGVYLTRFLDFAFQLDTLDPGIIAYCLSAKIMVTIPSRIDPYSLNTGTVGFSTVTFTPTGTTVAAGFNGGPATGDLPAIQGTIINASAGDDLFVQSVGLSSAQVAVKNGGSFVVRSINLQVQGF